ncbi:hypothetical protein AWZ03_002656 [Drosophila navojoa]|uniref:Uncharacterized protein n=1 Tax=Drosophila navojoa TaxID=7232 RepID=A0A484BTC7_DRONA|nr:hypothetical protein AWZ03_002656 [Drosophila navojoa]
MNIHWIRAPPPPLTPPAEAPPPSQPASSLGGGPPTTSQTPLGGTSGMLLVGVAAGITVVLLNVFVIGCCLHKRNEKRLKRGIEMMPAELTEDSSNTPNLLIIAISLAAFGFLLVNAALVAWFFVHHRRKKVLSGSVTASSSHFRDTRGSERVVQHPLLPVQHERGLFTL